MENERLYCAINFPAIHLRVILLDLMISKEGLAIYLLSPSMQTGIAQLDAEHQDLVTEINLISDAEKCGELPKVLKRLQEFRNHLAEHFDIQDRYTHMVRYPSAGAHARHHAETVTVLDRILDDLTDGAIELGEIAAACFHELFDTVVIMDMRFVNWHAEVKQRVPVALDLGQG